MAEKQQQFFPQARGTLAAAEITALTDFSTFLDDLATNRNTGLIFNSLILEQLAEKDGLGQLQGLDPSGSGESISFADLSSGDTIRSLFQGSAAGGGDIFPGLNAPADLPFVIQSGGLIPVADFEQKFGPISELTVPGTATEPGGEDLTIEQEFEQRLAISRGEQAGGRQTQAAFRSRVGRGRGSTILGGLGDEEKTTILGG